MENENPHVMPEIDRSKGMEIGLYSLGEHMPNPHTGELIPASQRLKEIVEAAKMAEDAGLDVFQVGNPIRSISYPRRTWFCYLR